MPENMSYNSYITRKLLSGILFLLSFANVAAQERIMINYSLEQGLPQASVLCIYQDKVGNMWFGTQGGVSKYNGNSFVNYDTRNGFADNHITAIMQDSKGRYWFGHRYKGLTLMHGCQISKVDLTDIQISAICEDDYGNIWIGTVNNGLYILPANIENICENYKRMDVVLNFPQSYIMNMQKGSNGKIIIGSTAGLAVIQSSKDLKNVTLKNFDTRNSSLPYDEIVSFERESGDIYWLMGVTGITKISLSDPDNPLLLDFYDFGRAIPISLSNNIVMDKSQIIWGCYDNGIYRFEDGKFNFEFNESGYKNNQTNCVFLDHDNNLWIGTMNHGIFKYSGDKFIVFNEACGLPNNVICSVIRDKSGNLWISTDGGTVIYDGQRFINFNEQYHLQTYPVSVIFEDSRGMIWLGNVYHDPLLCYNPKNKTLRKFTDIDGTDNHSVITINEDIDGNIWFASVFDPPFRYTYPHDGNPEKFTSFTKEDGLCSNRFWIIHRDLTRNLWFGSDDGGLTKYDGKAFINFGKNDGLNNPSPGAITNDSKNNIWIGSIGDGIYKFDGEKFTNYGIKDGLSSDNPFSIVCDDHDFVWIGTNTGIDRFDPDSETFKHYGKSDGFLGIENNQNSVYKDKDGIIWFGTINGLIRFDPSLDRQNTVPPVTVIEDIRLFYNPIDYSKYSDTLDRFSGLPHHMNLTYRNNHLTFNYVGISHVASDKVTYKYKLENFDEDWNPVTKSTIATYTNIPPGDYFFKVMAANNDGFWDEEPAILSFTISPPFWQTAWFRFIGAVFIVGLVYGLFWWRLRRIKAQKAKLELLVESKTQELIAEAGERKKAQMKAEEADKLKTAFLANMSHEIRTPVNSIIGFSDLLKDTEVDEESRKLYLTHIINGGNTLLKLINDIIDISRIEAGQIRIADEACNLSGIIRELFPVFFEQLKKRNKDSVELRISAGVNGSGPLIYSDPVRLRQIMTNLLSNAMKFTDSGYIEYGFELKLPGQIKFFVKDTGIGIPPEKQEIIFERFRQVEETYTRNYEGTGLGLAISKKLVNLMGGEMWLESTPGMGSAFFFTLPYKEVEFNNNIFANATPEFQNDDLTGKTILVVEDEISNFHLIENYLNRWHVKIIHTTEGEDAVEKFRIHQQEIDLVLMDIKIQGMDGYAATKEIKKISRSVPVIAQTAYAMTDEREKCLSAGCDDYISKPYTRQQLFEMVHKNLLLYNKLTTEKVNPDITGAEYIK